MNNIVMSNNFIPLEGFQSMDKINLIISTNELHNMNALIINLMDEVSENRSIFNYSIDIKEIDLKNSVLTINCLFDTNYIHTVYTDLEIEIKTISNTLDKLNKQQPLSAITRTLYDNRIDDLTQRNDELIKQQKVLKMQLFNAIHKRNLLVSKINRHINESIDDCIVTYICNTSEIEKTFMNMDGLLNTIYEIK